MPDEDFNNILELARSDVGQLVILLTREAMKRRDSGRTWFEHVLDRLDDECIYNLDENQLSGILQALSGMMDVGMKEDGAFRSFSLSLDGIANLVAKRCLKRLRELNPDMQAETVRSMAREGKAINWLIGKFFRSQLFRHGRVGHEAERPEQWEISEELLDDVIEILKRRVSEQGTKELIPNLPDISAYLYGWLNLTEDNQVEIWVREYSKSDEGFLDILNHLRGWAMSNKVYYPLSEKAVSSFLDWDTVITRLDSMQGGNFSDKVAELQLAIEQARD